ncbi:MAG: polysaccharide biosynthesis C-terminal domain-containing protein [Candidatus Aenigmarchaeota archaeon]|nr:polysaccharide biosynthesis C-terminal domain-containing protein [Candidatus Aenigmarchaeota archaeon]
MEVKRSLVSHTVWLFISWISSIILNFLFQLLAAKTLLPDQLGILAIAFNFASMVSALLIFGMENTIQRLTAYYLGKNQLEYLKSVLFFTLILTTIFNIVSILGIFLFSNEIAAFIKIPQNVLFFSIAMLLPISMSFFLAGILRGYQKIKYLAISAMLGDSIKFLTAGVLAFFGFKIFGFLIGYLVGSISIFLLRMGTLKLFVTKFKIPDLKSLREHAVPSFITQLFWMMLFNGQYLIVSILQSPYATGLFAVGMILSTQIYFIPRILSDALFPISSRLSAKKELVKQQSFLLNIALRYSLLIALPILFFVSIFPRKLIYLIGRAEFFPASNIVPILITAALFFGIGTLLSRTLYAIGRMKTFQNIAVVSTAFYIITSVTLTHYFSILGTALAYLMSTLLMVGISLYYLKKYINFKIDFPYVVKILLSAFIVYGILYLTSFFIPNLIIGGILSVIFTLSHFVILYFLKFYNENDIKTIDVLSEKFPKSSKYLKEVKKLLLKKINTKNNENK